MRLIIQFLDINEFPIFYNFRIRFSDLIYFADFYNSSE